MRKGSALAAVVVAAALAVGCNEPCKSESVDVIQSSLPACNGMAAGTAITVSFPVCVRCNEATPACRVDAQGNGFLLGPMAEACESGSSCPVPSCGLNEADRRTVTCTFTTPASGEIQVDVWDEGSGSAVPLTISLGGSNTSC